MNVFIVEDETAAFENVVDILNEIDPSITVVGNTESITQTVSWLRSNPAPDLILMDIHLSDGSAFSVFNYIEVETPVIFITAYDEYAIEAFKVNSIDYLLKPIKVNDLERALNKYSKLTAKSLLTQIQQVSQLLTASKYKDKFLLRVKDQILPVNVKDISCFYSTDKHTKVFLKNGSAYTLPNSLDQIMTSLNPVDFIRANKQFIVSRESVGKITIWFDNRLLVTLDVEIPERIYISKNKAADFKSWLVSE